MNAGGLLGVFFYDAGALDELKNFSAACGRMLLLDMREEVGAGTRFVFAIGTYQRFAALGRTTFERRLGLGTEG
jgi:hypothetical protein